MFPVKAHTNSSKMRLVVIVGNGSLPPKSEEEFRLVRSRWPFWKNRLRRKYGLIPRIWKSLRVGDLVLAARIVIKRKRPFRSSIFLVEYLSESRRNDPRNRTRKTA